MTIDNEKLKEVYFSEALEKIKEIVNIPSFSATGAENAPYGKEVKKVLKYALSLADSLGFKTYCDPENKYGYVEYGSGEKTFAILGHLDVVPPGNLGEWKTPPFDATIINNIMYGRGVLDDKGPTILNLYCLKYLKDHNYKPKHKIRLIFGLTEETTWDSINTYMTKEPTPDFGYTPDGLFPITYAEKAIVNLDIIGPGAKNVYLDAGNAYNVTCATANVKNVDIDALHKIALKKNYRVEKQNKELIINGKPAHGSRPAEGVNAGLQSLIALNELEISHPLINFVVNELQEDTSWNKYFKEYHDESGGFTINVGMVQINEKESKLCCNIRIPVHTDYQIILNKIKNIIKPYSLRLEIEHYDKPLFMPVDSPLVSNLMKIYKNITKDEKAKPIAIGGGTYARSMPNCVAFGAIFNEKTSTEHTYNECIKIDELWKAMQIYVNAIAVMGTQMSNK